tara:strand:- start:324 stop:527 length:204 start_codon:yes stop_codon:yes gene_type:complete
MNVGDLVKINDLKEPDSNRELGTIVKHDIYDSQFGSLHEKISEVLWNSGKLSWILTSRLEKINNIQE